jgi:hypothetical protein
VHIIIETAEPGVLKTSAIKRQGLRKPRYRATFVSPNEGLENPFR